MTVNKSLIATFWTSSTKGYKIHYLSVQNNEIITDPALELDNQLIHLSMVLAGLISEDLKSSTGSSAVSKAF